MGVRQWGGQPLFRVADLEKDRDLLEFSAAEAQRLLATDPELGRYPQLRAELERQRL